MKTIKLLLILIILSTAVTAAKRPDFDILSIKFGMHKTNVAEILKTAYVNAGRIYSNIIHPHGSVFNQLTRCVECATIDNNNRTFIRVHFNQNDKAIIIELVFQGINEEKTRYFERVIF